jgi:hypothetical protein
VFYLVPAPVNSTKPNYCHRDLEYQKTFSFALAKIRDGNRVVCLY